MNRISKTSAGLAVLALAAAPVTFAAKPDKPDKPDKPHAVGYVFKGTYSGDGSTVAVTKGNKHAERAGLVDTSVAFDFAGAKIVTTDTNGDGVKTIDDVAAGDKVQVKARLPKSDPGAGPMPPSIWSTRPIPRRSLLPLPRSSPHHPAVFSS